MPRWISHKPGHHADMNDALPSFVTRSCTLLATGYAKLMQNNGGKIPAKNGLDISSFGPVMANTALGAVTLGSACTFRIAGESIRERFAQKLVGTDYYDLVDPARRSCAMKSMDMAVSFPCAFRAELLQKYDNGEERRAEACAFPLLSDEPDIDGFILFANEDIDRTRRISVIRPVLTKSWVIHRELIDLGFGIDESFEDLVPRDLMLAPPAL
ncbi:PAS domain-containing protein [Nisaea nitritireducens]|uniref:hypothetical protein n=1 Tax=Nisaea nitritireducens TaxID=568392 RepID=UPI001865D90A|nr:hypothetical protein [Nisaea nitritireducens]